MNPPGGKACRPSTAETYARQAHTPAAKLPDDDLVFFLLDVVLKLDLSTIHARYKRLSLIIIGARADCRPLERDGLRAEHSRRKPDAQFRFRTPRRAACTPLPA